MQKEPNPWAWLKVPETEGRTLTLLVSGTADQSLWETLNKLTANYDKTILFGKNLDSVSYHGCDLWAREHDTTFQMLSPEPFQSWMQFMGPDGGKAVLLYGSNSETEDFIADTQAQVRRIAA